MMRSTKSIYDGVRKILKERLFNERQIENILPHLQDEYIQKPDYLREIIDTWNLVMSKQAGPKGHDHRGIAGQVPAVAKPSESFPLKGTKIDMNKILGDLEPRLLLLHPQKLIERQAKINELGVTHSINDHWLLLMHAPRGFYLQQWSELMRKFLYIQDNVLDFLFEQKKQREMTYHPLLKNAAVTEVDIDHIRTRYLFAHRCGYVPLANMYPIKIAREDPTLKELILDSDKEYLTTFAPFCSLEEYSSFANLIKNYEIDEEDIEVVNKLVELHCI